MIYLFLIILLLFQIFQYLLLKRLDKTISTLFNLDSKGFQKMALDFTQLETAVTDLVTVEAGAEATLTALEQEVTLLASEAQDPADQAKLNSFATQIGVTKSALAAAIAAVPAADIPPVVVAPTPTPVVAPAPVAVEPVPIVATDAGHVFTGNPSEINPNS